MLAISRLYSLGTITYTNQPANQHKAGLSRALWRRKGEPGRTVSKMSGWTQAGNLAANWDRLRTNCREPVVGNHPAMSWPENALRRGWWNCAHCLTLFGHVFYAHDGEYQAASGLANMTRPVTSTPSNTLLLCHKTRGFQTCPGEGGTGRDGTYSGSGSSTNRFYMLT